MEIYKKSDLELVDKNIDKIIEDIEEIRKKNYPRETDDKTIVSDTESTTTTQEKKLPAPEDVKEIVKIVMNFVKDKKRKIYGGFGLNAIIKSKNKNDAFYSDDEIPDVDVYSPTPIEDLVELCYTLNEKGFTDVFGKEAMHEGTYKIFTRGYNAIDLSYVPKMIYDNIPFVELNNVRYVHPHFAMIDFYRIMSEPYFSSWRWAKVFKRLNLIQKHYPIEKTTGDLLKPYLHKIDMTNVTNTIENFILNYRFY